MPTALLPQTSADHFAEQHAISGLVLAAVGEIWGRTAPDDFDDWFDANIDQIVAAITLGQRRAVIGADDYVAAVLAELETPVEADVEIDPAPLVGVASDGRGLDGLMYGPIITAKHHVALGESPGMAWSSAGQAALMQVQTQLADASRVAVGLGITARRGVGYVRMLNRPSCSRCAVLAGRWYRKAGFLRHPRCDCRHIPSTRRRARSLATDARKYFDSLTEAEQNRAFTVSGAEAIRDGSDIAQVVNARRGMNEAGVYGRTLLITTEGVTRRGLAGKRIRARGRTPKRTPRLMPEAIYQIAEDRADVLRLLHLNGYLR
ncbi:hypothetical protein NDR87_30905 [Nocardia sp. CDC159]|uniref:Uncharacterized protein n=1 Tax=Nocardia pulmonis TaxID=2951408 RepID=A0A9X2ECV0_9NOCA|nr:MULTISPECIES: hypothetical protein [Nocardia]MCM6778040.1 hypothetical protein [Nocardia pulmonis]MCM6790789.1 hypothetical protein [Nocardia sp. CDC159]